MELDQLRAERRRVAADLANVEKGIKDVEVMLATRSIQRHKAELVLAECAEASRRLADQLLLLDTGLAELQRS
jgi:septal ring factor EnvC (AmiA/AmiB activator)